MERQSKIYVAGDRGLVGSAIARRLSSRGYTNIIGKTREELDLENQSAVRDFFDRERPEYVFLAAAKVGGIHANNTYRADFIYSNLEIQNNVIFNAYRYGVRKLCFLGSSCIYPKFAPQPIKEEYLLDGKLESTNEPYAVAKIAGVKMCQAFNRQYGTNFISVMPTNAYGPNDNFDLESSHVLAALVRKFVDAKIQNRPSVTIWGTGKPQREFIYVDDLADACVFLMERYDESEIVNIGTGTDIIIHDLALLIQSIAEYSGSLEFDPSKPDGTPRKLLDVSRLLSLGWKPTVPLEVGIRRTIEWYLAKAGIKAKA